jgi:Coenzyme PQQ synthesis protein D (PqqD)
MRLKKNIATSESGFIFHPGTGDSFSANPIAAEIILQLKDGLPASDIKKNILEKYDVPANMLEKDWDEFTAQLKEANLLDV